ncbi:splicing factor 3a subunit 2 [Encephalitozoon hellem]|nr:splicing factor 3a subunit 2 [Encephalitozoon hellem]
MGFKIGNAYTTSEIKKHRKERNKRLLLEVYGLTTDQNLSKDGAGRYICVVCKTKHLTEMSYVRHREGKKHKEKLSGKSETKSNIPSHSVRCLVEGDKKGYGITIDYKLAKEMPQFRFVSSLEQAVEEYDECSKYLVFICRPYENIGFKFENKEIDKSSIYEDIDDETGAYTLHFYFFEGS